MVVEKLDNTDGWITSRRDGIGGSSAPQECTLGFSRQIESIFTGKRISRQIN
jgi:hypothetical protein